MADRDHPATGAEPGSWGSVRPRRYFNARIHPQLIVENYRPEPGYIWVRGQWRWSGYEWQWSDGHFVPDPQYANYYDDGSYDDSINLAFGG